MYFVFFQILLGFIITISSMEAKDYAKFLNNFFKQNSLVFDVGAYIGVKAELYLKQGAKVICFEPQPYCIEQLKQKFKDNRYVTIEGVGLSASPGVLELFICSYAKDISTFSQQWVKDSRFAKWNYQWDKKVLVPVFTLDSMILKYGKPSFIKIDVENFELEVLKGLTQSVDCLSIEFHQETLENSKKCLEYLASIGMSYFNFALGEEPLLISPKKLNAFELIDQIEILIKQKGKNGFLWGDIYSWSNL